MNTTWLSSTEKWKIKRSSHSLSLLLFFFSLTLMSVRRDVTFSHFFPHLSFILLCLSLLHLVDLNEAVREFRLLHRNQIRELHPSSQLCLKAWTKHNVPFCFLAQAQQQHLCPESSSKERQPRPQHLLYQPKQVHLPRQLLMSQKNRTAAGAI